MLDRERIAIFGNRPLREKLLGMNIDVLLALTGLVVAVVMTFFSAVFLNRTVYVIFGLSLAMTFSLWFLLRRRVGELSGFKGNRTMFMGLCSAFFLILSLSIMVLYLRPEIYGRPTIYFVLLAVMAGTVAVQVFVLPPGRGFIVLVLAQLLSLGFSIAYSQLLLFPGVVGVDPAIHQGLVQDLIATGKVSQVADYSSTPLFQIALASGSLITGLDYRSSTIFIVSSLEIVVTALAVFLIGRYLFNERVGLFACLLLTVAPYHIYFSIWLVPNTLALVGVPLIIYLLYKVRRTRSVAGLALAVVLMVALIIMHPVASLGLAIILPVMWSVYAIYGRLVVKKERVPVTFHLTMFFIIAMLGWWSYVGHQIDFIAGQISTGFSIEYLSVVPEIVTTFVYTIPITEQVLRYLGMFAFFSVCLIGSLYVVTKRNRNVDRVSIVAAGLLPVGIGFVSLALALTGLDARWFYLAEVMLAVPAAVFFLSIFSKKKARPVAAAIMFVSIVLLAFFAMANPSGSIDNHDMFPNTGVRYTYTESELTGASCIARVSTGNISSDFDYSTDASSSVFMNNYGVDATRIESLDDELLYGNFTRDGSLKVIRSAIAQEPIRMYALPYHLEYDPQGSLDRSAAFDKVYDNGGVAAYY